MARTQVRRFDACLLSYRCTSTLPINHLYRSVAAEPSQPRSSMRICVKALRAHHVHLGWHFCGLREVFAAGSSCTEFHNMLTDTMRCCPGVAPPQVALCAFLLLACVFATGITIGCANLPAVYRRPVVYQRSTSFVMHDKGRFC